MTLGGLPGAHAGILALSSVLSIILSCAGLLLLRAARPGDQEREDSNIRKAMCGGVAIVGALTYFIGLVLSSMPFLVGSSGVEGRESAIIGCTLVLFLAIGECVMSGEIDIRKATLCTLVWLGTTLIEWAGPRAYDNMTTGFESQIGGCDGGYRSAFLIYMSIWLTCIIFGALLMVCEDSPLATLCSDKDEDQDDPLSYRSPRSAVLQNVGSLRRKALPVIFGFSTSMSGLAFCVGSASDQLSMVFFGAVLLVLAVLTAWDWLWRLELPLVMWAALTQGLSCLARTAQTHLAFRDLRWDVAGAYNGPLEIERSLGLPLFVIGFGMLIVACLLLVHSVDQDALELEKPAEDEEEEDEEEDESSPCRIALEFTLLALAIGFLIPGLTLPLYMSERQFPHLVLDGKQQGGGGAAPLPEAPNMFTCINMAYTNELPCTALVSIFQFLVIPPLQLMGNFILIWRPKEVPKDLLFPLRDEIAQQAPFRFMNPLMVATTLAISHWTWNIMLKEIGVPENNELLNNKFGLGAYFMLAYALCSVILAQVINCEQLPQVRPTPNEVEDDDSDVEEDDVFGMDNTFAAVSLSLFLIPLVGVATYCALTTPFITFQIRLSGIILKVVHPTLMELYSELTQQNVFLGWLAFITFFWNFAVWSVLFMLRIPFAVGKMDIECLEFCNLGYVIKRAEQIIRPWVMTHMWTLCFFLLFYILTGKNKAIQEVCVRPPPSILGLLGLAILYGGLQLLLNNAKVISPEDTALRVRKKRPPNLPGGVILWKTLIVSSVIFWVTLFFYMGPVHKSLVSDYHDVNHKLEEMIPMITHKIKGKIPHSSGDCAARWRQKNPNALVVDEVAAHNDCQGHHAITKMNKNPVNVTARWIEGLNTLSFKELKIDQPTNNVGPQLWNLTLSGEFTDLHIWLKVMLGGKLWINDYMCCKNPFRFSLRASALCTEEHGFYSPVKLAVASLDPFDWKHDANWQDAMGSHITLSVDYGQKSSVQDSVREIFVSQIGEFKIRLLDGKELQPLNIAAEILQTVVKQNSGSKCPRMPVNLPVSSEL